MADDSLDISEKLNFHSCDTPRGCTYYNLDVLTTCQQQQLNELKLRTIKGNEKYLRRHPEIRAFVSLITRWVLRKRPRRHVNASIQEFFNRPRSVIESEVEAYIAKRRRQATVEVDDEEEESVESEEEVHLRYVEHLSAESEMLPKLSAKRKDDKVEDEEESGVLETVSTTEFIRLLLEEHQRNLPLGDIEAGCEDA